MEPIRVRLVADPAAPTEMAHSMTDLSPLDGTDAWDLTVVSRGDVTACAGRITDARSRSSGRATPKKH